MTDDEHKAAMIAEGCYCDSCERLAKELKRVELERDTLSDLAERAGWPVCPACGSYAVESSNRENDYGESAVLTTFDCRMCGEKWAD